MQNLKQITVEIYGQKLGKRLVIWTLICSAEVGVFSSLDYTQIRCFDRKKVIYF